MENSNRKDRSNKGLTLSEVEFVENTSGWKPTRYTVLMRKDKVEETTAGGIIIGSEVTETEEWTVTTGVLVATGSLAFSEGRDKDGALIFWDEYPKVGQRVRIKEYTGQRFIGDDEEKYVQVNDTEIIGVQA